MGFAGGLVEGICLPMQKMKERQVQSLDRKDTLEEETATHSNILGYKIPRTEEPGWLQSIELQRLRHDWAWMHTRPRIICWESDQSHPVWSVTLRVYIPSTRLCAAHLLSHSFNHSLFTPDLSNSSSQARICRGQMFRTSARAAEEMSTVVSERASS